jgi:hypothetical protein
MWKPVLILVGVAGLCGCSDISYFTTGATIAGANNPLGVVNTVNTAVLVGNKAVNWLAKDKTPAPEAPKSFQPNPYVLKDFTDNVDVMQFVMDSQDKYKGGDYGAATDEQKKASVGRYISVPLGKTLVINDAQKFYRVAYEGVGVVEQKK